MDGLFGGAGCHYDRQFLANHATIARELTAIRQLLEVSINGQNRGSSQEPGEGEAETPAPPSQGAEEEGGRA
jgi:hypothetical protein